VAHNDGQQRIRGGLVPLGLARPASSKIVESWQRLRPSLRVIPCTPGLSRQAAGKIARHRLKDRHPGRSVIQWPSPTYRQGQGGYVVGRIAWDTSTHRRSVAAAFPESIASAARSTPTHSALDRSSSRSPS
jgi:hypothetical protein